MNDYILTKSIGITEDGEFMQMVSKLFKANSLVDAQKIADKKGYEECMEVDGDNWSFNGGGSTWFTWDNDGKVIESK